MAWRIASPCTVMDLAEVVERATPLQMGMWRAQIAAGTSFALRDGLGVAVACGGLVAAGDEAQAWFVVHRMRGPRAALAIVRAIALTLAACPYPAIRIEVETPMGRRIARLIGAEPVNGSQEVFYVSHYQPVQETEGQQRPGAG